MPTQRRSNRPSPLLVAGLVALPLAVASAVGPGQQPRPEAQPPAGASAAVLRGRVTTKTGAPLPGALVRVAVPAADMRFVDVSTHHVKLETRSDAEGDYQLALPGVAVRTKVSIDAMMPGFRRLSGTLMAGGDAKDVEVEPGKVAEANLALEPARHLGGTVVDEQGRPIPWVQVSAFFAFDRGTGGVERTASGPDGAFELFNYPAEPHAFRKMAGKGFVTFSDPDHIEFRIEDVDAIEPDRRGDLRVVLPTGRKVAGVVVGVDGRPVPEALVEALPEAGAQRKATLTDADGKFALKGLGNGPTTLSATSLAIKQKARLPLALDRDREGLEVRLQAIDLPADLASHAVLGMRLADVTPALKSAYDLFNDRGALILEPGRDSDRLKIGRLAEGYTFWMVGDRRVGGVREFVDGILAETAGPAAEASPVRVVYSFKTPEFVGTNTQYLRLRADDLKELQALSDQLKATPR